MPDVNSFVNNIALGDENDNFTPGNDDVKLDEHGNQIDDNGQIVKTADAIKKEADDKAAAEAAEAERLKAGVINTNGDLVDKDGVVLKTKAELEAEAATEDEAVVKEVIKKVGVPIFDSKGNEIEYEDTPEGLAKYAVDLANYNAKQQLDKFLKAKYAKFPLLKAIENHLELHGSLEGFNAKKDYTVMQFNPKDEDACFDIIVEAEMSRGNTKERAETIANLFKDKKQLETEGKVAYDYLKSKQVADMNEMQALIDKRTKDNEAYWAKYWSEVEDKVVTQGKLYDGLITIPQNIKIKKQDGTYAVATREDFFSFVSDVVDDHGNTMENIVDSKMPLDQRLFFSFLKFTNGDMSQLIRQQVGKEKSKDLKERMKRNHTPGGGGANSGGAATGGSKSALDNIIV